jgi:hypothetical protein
LSRYSTILLFSKSPNSIVEFGLFFVPSSNLLLQNLTLDIPKILLLGDGLLGKTPSTLYRKYRIYDCKMNQSNNLNLKSMKKSNILLVIAMVALQGFFACKSDDISPQKVSESPLQVLIRENHLKKVLVAPSSNKIIYLKNVDEASRFFAGLNNKLKSPVNFVQSSNQLSSVSQTTANISKGTFTFSNGDIADIVFNGNDGILFGGVSSVTLNNETNISYTYEETSGYLDITKWGYIAIQQQGELGNSYDYYYAPITRWEAYLNNGWSVIRYFNTEANLNVEGFGTFVMQ